MLIRFKKKMEKNRTWLHAGRIQKNKSLKSFVVFDSKGCEKQMIETFIVKNRKRVPVRLPYSIYAREIVEKYDNNFNPLLFPIMAEQTMNDSIKEMCRIAGFNELTTTVYYRGGKEVKAIHQKWELTSTHTGRKSFISKCVVVPNLAILSFP
jgi:hypothetical protein